MTATTARLPRDVSLEALRVFDAAARHLSFTRAAEELRLTQGAVSHRIKALEERIGLPLFERLTRTLALTPAGESLSRAVRQGLAVVEEGVALTLSEREPDRDSPLRLTLSTSLASLWLLPRLDRLLLTLRTSSGRPDLNVTVLAEDRLLALGRDGEADVAIRFGPVPRPRSTDRAALYLGGDEVFPVCSPSFLDRFPEAREISATLGWRGLPMLVDDTAESDKSGCSWGEWSVGCWGERWTPARVAATLSHAHLALNAAIGGVGIALARSVLAQDLLVDGRLTRLGGPTAAVPARYAYRLYGATRPNPLVRGLASWLRRELANTVT